MRHKCLILTVFALCCVCLVQFGCQEQAKAEAKAEDNAENKLVSKTKAVDEVKPKTEPEIKQSGPRLTFEKVIHDFGDVSPGTRHTYNFKFTNTGDKVLKINRKIKSSCRCTVPKLAKYDYLPGESGVIGVKYHAGTAQRIESRRLTINSNDPKKSNITLTIKARITLKVRSTPEKIKLFLDKENAGCPKITLASIDKKTFSISSFKSRPDCITADFQPLVKAADFTIQPKVDIEKLRKSKRGKITFGLTHPGCKKIEVPFEMVPEFKTKPALINVRQAEPNEPVIRELLILNNYGQAFEVESTSSQQGMIKVLSQEQVLDKKGIGNRYKFNLEITPPARDGKKRFFRDVFSVNIKGGEKLAVNCTGFYSRGKVKYPADANLAISAR